jgi:hypothetical protein
MEYIITGLLKAGQQFTTDQRQTIYHQEYHHNTLPTTKYK